MQYSDIGTTSRKLSLISGHARRDRGFQFTSLAHLLDVEVLRDCYESFNRNTAVGIDGVSWKECGEDLTENLDRLVQKLKLKSYKPKPARRVYIPKNETETRPLGISARENKIVERGLTWILESIYEQDYLNSSYGFRRGRSAHQALKQINDPLMFQPVNYIVEADIKGFFDKVSQEHLMEFVRIRIRDMTLLNLIKKYLKAGYADAGLLVTSDEGTPQGSILSPMLSNIFLHYVLDTWYETTVKSHVRGYCELVRYADDFICLVRYADDAKRIERGLHNRFNKYGLALHPAKTRRIGFGHFVRENAERQNRRANRFDFLGFTHYCDTSRKGNFKVGRTTTRKKFAAKCKVMNRWFGKIRNVVPTKDWWKTFQAKTRGHLQYYRVGENYAGVRRFYNATIRMVHKWMNRRSQKRKMSWERFTEYLGHYPLPKLRIMHSFYTSPAR